MADDDGGPSRKDGKISFLDELTALVRRLDPPPMEVLRAARESFASRTLDAELVAVLAHDSVMEDVPVGVRGDDGPRMLTFEAPEFTAVVEVTETGDRRRLLGQLTPPRPADVEVRHRDGTTLTVRADELGRFTAADVAAGAVHVVCRFDDGAGARVIEMDWVVV